MATSLDAFAYPAVSRPRSAFQHLVWKDFRMLQPLLLAGIIGTAALFLLAVLRAAIDPVSDPSLTTLSVLWVLLPNLVALGIPPISLGTENEERTLDWLRTLPVTWWQVLLSKLLVGFAAWVLAVLTASVCFVLSWLVLRGGWDWSAIGRISGSESIVELMVYGVGLLICGWIAALIVRNPVGSVMLVIPLILGVTLLWNFSIAGLVSTHFHYGVTFLEATAAQRVSMFCLAVVFLAALGAVIAGLARHRLAGASDHRWQAPAAASTSAWQPSVVQVAWHARPRPFRALLWQQFRQTRFIICAAILFALVTVVAALVDGKPDYQGAMIVLGWPAAHLMLGVVTFHGDRRGMRQGFFADRGWSPNLIWVTRLIPTASASLFLILVFPFVSGLDLYLGMHYGTGTLWQAFGFSVVVQALLFLIGVLTGQWGRRPSLAFFGAPVVALLWMLPAFGLLAFYGGYTSLLWLAASVLLFATRRLTPFVMEGVSSAAVWGRGLAYCLLALGVMCLCLFVHHWWTTPPEMPAWRNEMLAIVEEPVTPEILESTIGVLPGTRNLELNADVYPLDRFDEGMKKIMLQTEFPNVGTADAGKMQFTIRLHPSFHQSGLAAVEAVHLNRAEQMRDLTFRLDTELKSDTMMGEFVSQTELYKLCVRDPILGLGQAIWNGPYRYVAPQNFEWQPLRRKALEVSAKWSRLSREQSLVFGALGELLNNAESNEWIVIAGLRQIAYDQNLFTGQALPQGEEHQLDRETFIRVVDQLASADLRRESRQRCLIAEWQRFQTGEWSGWFDDELGNEKSFLEAPLSDPLYRLGIEQKRFERKLDVAVRNTLDQLESGLPEWDDPELTEQRLLWGELLKDRRKAERSLGHQEVGSPPRAPVFYREQDLLIDELRQMADRLREPQRSNVGQVSPGTRADALAQSEASHNLVLEFKRVPSNHPAR